MQTEQSPAVVQSRDGTTIAYERSGAGPAVVLVAGAFCDRGWFDSLAAELAADFTVYSYDRRGRGDSGDSRAFSIDARWRTCGRSSLPPVKHRSFTDCRRVPRWLWRPLRRPFRCVSSPSTRRRTWTTTSVTRLPK